MAAAKTSESVKKARKAWQRNGEASSAGNGGEVMWHNVSAAAKALIMQRNQYRKAAATMAGGSSKRAAERQYRNLCTSPHSPR